jgi:hypothetical protein
MEFRWVAAIAMWTILSGPIFNGKGGVYAPTPDHVSANAAKPTPALQPPPGQIRPSWPAQPVNAKACRTCS